MAKYQLAYGGNYDPSPANEPPPNKESEDPPGKKAKGVPNPPSWFEEEAAKSTKVYVSNLPKDITETEFVDFMQKCGLVLKDANGEYKIKLYSDEEGNKKGDGLCSYIKVESVHLALSILDGGDLRGNTISVERARFTLKGDYDATKKPKAKKRKDKEKFKKAQERLFAWKPEALRGVAARPKHEKVVVVQNAFSPSDFNKDVRLILEYQDDFREEANKVGQCKRVVCFDRHPEGILQIFMTTCEEADAVVNLYNNRFFGGRRISAFLWDGHTKYKIDETDAEREERIEGWDKFVTGEEEKK